MTQLLSQFRIANKIYTGYGLLIALLIGIGFLANANLTNTKDTFTQYRTLARETNLVGRLQANVLMTRLGVKDFIIKGDKEAIDTVKERLAKAKEFQAEGAKEMHDPQRMAAIEAIGAQLDTYASGFDKVIALQSKRHEAVAILNEIGPATRKKITAITDGTFKDGNLAGVYEAGNAQENFILARLYVQKFLIGNKEEDAAQTRTEFTELDASFKKLSAALNDPSRQKILEDIMKNIAVYRQSFDDVVALITERNGIIQNTLDKTGPEIAETIEQLKLGLKNEQDTLGPLAIAGMESALSTQFILTIAGLLLAIAAAFVISRSITVPVKTMTNAMKTLADGNLETEIPATGFRDEIGDMAKTVQIFKENAIKRKELEALAGEESELRMRRQERIDSLIADFRQEAEELLGSVSVNMDEMQDTALTLAALAEQTATQTGTASSASQNASSNVQTVAAASEELNSSIREISEQINRAMDIVKKATSTAQTTNEQVAALNEAAQKIGAVVNLISDIAEQTNLLALNATIEAARAGDAGRGFAVVATEVKQLAEQTAKATGEINAQISGIQASTEEAVASIKNITETINEVNVYTTNIAAAVEEQDAATNEISRSAQEASNGTSLVSNNVNDVREAVGRTKQSAEAMQNVSRTTAEKSDLLKSVVDRFLSDVAAA